MNIVFEKAKNGDDYKKIARLIYDTDPYLYPDLFGSLNQAENLVGILFNDKNSIFFKDNIYLAKIDSEIVGIVSILPHGTEWDFDSIRMAYMECGYKITSACKAVCEYFEETYNRIGLGANACNVCVAENYREKKIGSFILEKVIALAGRNNIELSVLKSNEAAIKLYKKFGFITVKEYYDYGGYNKEKVLCLSMIRLADIN